MRILGIHSKNFVFDDSNRLDLKHDPKFLIAEKEELMIDINSANFKELIRVPGIGLKTAQKILESRPVRDIRTLKSLGVILKRASPFVEINGMHQSKLSRWIN